MVEQTRRPNRAVTLQAGPGEVADGSLRIRDRAARVVGRQLAEIGDLLNQDWARRDPNRPPTPLYLLGPARTLTRIIYRDLHNQLWGFQNLWSPVKAWIVSTTSRPGNLRAEAKATWVSSLKVVACLGWTRGALMTVALLAAASIFGGLWM
ncbi:bcl-2-interacting killer [Poeciliopsis prolifica]|uniref:bcl-2-interacting killer n=1 Tax=Poeciliopsis prolifica TaxID=188132 RepID=UPI002413077B|nr:bcl-2-interacting killer [Poeciliopsis prolifica]